jgi:threonine synthase
MRRLLRNPGEKGLFLQTAHPVKFPGCVEKATGREVAMPTHLGSLMGKPKRAFSMDATYEDLREFLSQIP